MAALDMNLQSFQGVQLLASLVPALVFYVLNNCLGQEGLANQNVTSAGGARPSLALGTDAVAIWTGKDRKC